MIVDFSRPVLYPARVLSGSLRTFRTFFCQPRVCFFAVRNPVLTPFHDGELRNTLPRHLWPIERAYVVIFLRMPPQYPGKNTQNTDRILEGHGQSAIVLGTFNPENLLKNGDWL